MADQGSGNPGNLPVPGGGGAPPAPQGGGGPSPTKRLPDWVTTQGPTGSVSETGTSGENAVTGSASASGQLGSATAEGSMGTATARAVYGDASISASSTNSAEGINSNAGASVGAGVLTVDGKTGPLASGLANASGGGRVLAADAEASGTAKLTREEATLSGKLGASAVVAEVHAKGEIVLTPQRLYNGIIVNGVNAFAEWRKYSYRMKQIQNGALDHGIVLSGEAGAQFGASAKAEGHFTKTESGWSIGGKVTGAAGPGGSLGGSIGWQ